MSSMTNKHDNDSDYADMHKNEYRDMHIHAINGEQVLYILDALEFYTKHYKKVVPSRIAKAMKQQSESIRVEIVDTWNRGVRLHEMTWEPLTSDDEFDISKFLNNHEK